MDRCFDILRAESFGVAFGEAVAEDPDSFGAHIKDNVALGHTMSLADRGWAHAEQTRILRKFNALMPEFDVIVLPTSPVSPFPWTQSHADEIDGQTMDIYYRWLALCYRGSLTGGPSITLPCGRDPLGMPFGLQMLGPVRGDEGLLAAAKAVETLFAALPRQRGLWLICKPCPHSEVDLRSIVTHPPDLSDSAQRSASRRPADGSVTMWFIPIIFILLLISGTAFAYLMGAVSVLTFIAVGQNPVSVDPATAHFCPA